MTRIEVEMEKPLISLGVINDLSNNSYDVLLRRAIDLVEEETSKENFMHIVGVLNISVDLSLLIMQEGEEVDLEVVKLAAIFHDVMLNKVKFENHARRSANRFIDFIVKQRIDLSQKQVDNIVHCICSHSARCDGRLEEPSSIEAQIIFDANILQQLGDSGIVYFIKNSKERDVVKIARDLLNNFERRVFALLTPYGRFIGEMRMEKITQFVNNILNGR